MEEPIVIIKLQKIYFCGRIKKFLSLCMRCFFVALDKHTRDNSCGKPFPRPQGGEIKIRIVFVAHNIFALEKFLMSKGVSMFKGGPSIAPAAGGGSGGNAWSKPEPQLPKWNEDDPKEFAESLYQIWFRLQEPVQQRISNVLLNPIADGKALDYLEYTDSYTVMRKISSEAGITKAQLREIKTLIFTTALLTLNQKRTHLLKLYATYQAQLSVDQREMLAGIVGHMVPVHESFLAPAHRVITSAITNGADFDAFQMFIDFLHVTLRINKGKSV